MVSALRVPTTIHFYSLRRFLAVECSPVAIFCSSWTNKLITAKDHGSIQMNIGHLDESGVYDGTQTTFALKGGVRAHVRPSLCYLLGDL